ncbi:hypothetical protein GGI42DRAFT_331664 [Trichoderma sp. SZMC 28013]
MEGRIGDVDPGSVIRLQLCRSLLTLLNPLVHGDDEVQAQVALDLIVSGCALVHFRHWIAGFFGGVSVLVLLYSHVDRI